MDKKTLVIIAAVVAVAIAAFAIYKSTAGGEPPELKKAQAGPPPEAMQEMLRQGRPGGGAPVGSPTR